MITHQRDSLVLLSQKMAVWGTMIPNVLLADNIKFSFSCEWLSSQVALVFVKEKEFLLSLLK